MMLRSSSTPILGSLLSSYSESPTSHQHSEMNPSKQRYSPILFHHHHHQNHNKMLGSFHLINACQSPNSPYGSNGFRRVRSEGNLDGLLASSASFDGSHEFDNLSQPNKFSIKNNHTVLQTIPSFSFHNSLQLFEDEEADGEREEDGLEEQGKERAEAIFDNFGLEKSYSYPNQASNLPCEEESERIVSKMHIAMGLGVNDFAGFIGGSYGGGGGGSKDERRGSNGDDGSGPNNVEDYYKRMIQENPDNPLFMRNYAEFLHQIKNDLRGAEEYYSRAILADPRDGEALSRYARLIWELHHDQDRAASYFERAVQAAPEDSLVLAAHANFLWETEEEEIEGGAPEGGLDKVAPLLHEDPVAAVKA